MRSRLFIHSGDQEVYQTQSKVKGVKQKHKSLYGYEGMESASNFFDNPNFENYSFILANKISEITWMHSKFSHSYAKEI